MRVLRAIGVLGLTVALVACSPREEREEAAREETREALARGDRQEALDALARLRAVQPDTAEAVVEYATLLITAGEAPEAVWVLEEGVVRFDDHDLRLALANTLILVNDPARSRAVSEQIPAEAPQHARSLMLRAQAELKLGNLDAAFAVLDRAERDYPEEPGVRLPRISALLEQRRFDDARRAIGEARAATEDEGMQAILRRFEASIYVQDAREGDVEGAIAGVRVLVDEAPEDTDLWGSLIQLLFAQRRHAEARDLLVAALDEDPERLPLYVLLAAVESAQGDSEAAEATLRRLIERQPSATAYAELSGLLAKKEDPDAALAVLDEGLAAVEGADALHIVRAETLLEAGRVDDAAEVVASLDAYDVDPKQRLLLRARIALDRGDAESARDQLEELVPELDNAATQFWLGQALEATGDLAGAERRYGVALNRSTRDPAGAFAAYQLAAARGDWQTAAAYGQMMMTRAPGRDDAWRAVLVALVELGDGPRAEKIATAGVQHFPEDDRLRALHAASLRIQGRHEEALAALGPPAEDEPTPVASERGMALAASGDLASARETLGAAIERAPEAPELQHALATVLYQAGGAEEGDAAVDRALALDPDDLRPLRRRLEFRAATGRLDGARADAERYLALRPQDAGVHYVAGVVNEGLGRSDDAIAAYRRAAELDATAVAPRNNLAVLLGHSGKLEEALEAAQQAYRLEPGSPYVLDTLGWLYLKSERVERAISLLEEATALEPPLPDAQLHLALAYRDAGRTEEARELLVALGPTAPEPLRAEVEKALATLR